VQGIPACVTITSTIWKGDRLARSNYNYEKRRKELARKKKREEKKQRKLASKNPEPTDTSQPSPDSSSAA